MILEAIALGYLAGDYVYHRWIASDDPPPNPNQTITVPTSEEGMAIPLIYGRVLVKAPIVWWAGNSEFNTGATFGVDAQWNYGMDMHLVVGIFPQDGEIIFYGLWTSNKQMGFGPGLAGPPVAVESNNLADVTSGADAGYVGGFIEILPGDPAQDVVAMNALIYQRMTAGGVPATQISSMRGVFSIFLTSESGLHAWQIGSSPNPGTYSVEVMAAPHAVVIGGIPYIGHGLIGDDLNPVDILLDLLTGGLGKLGIPSSKLDMVTFDNAAGTLAAEEHGMSRSWEDSADAKTRINEICQQVDGIMREDPVTGLHSFKLIRADFDPTTIPEINPTNCVELQNFAAGGWTGLPNDIYVTFTDRLNSYGNGSGRAQNQANASGQGGEVVTVTLSMPGICTKATADAVADRELQARSKPIAKCRAIVDRSFLRVLPGDPVKLTWPDANVAGVIFRVAAVNRGTLENPTIALDLLQDYFYTHRNIVHPPIPTGGHVFGESL